MSFVTSTAPLRGRVSIAFAGGRCVASIEELRRRKRREACEALTASKWRNAYMASAQWLVSAPELIAAFAIRVQFLNNNNAREHSETTPCSISEILPAKAKYEANRMFTRRLRYAICMDACTTSGDIVTN